MTHHEWEQGVISYFFDVLPPLYHVVKTLAFYNTRPIVIPTPYYPHFANQLDKIAFRAPFCKRLPTPC